jgi:hypothetical protein
LPDTPVPRDQGGSAPETAPDERFIAELPIAVGAFIRATNLGDIEGLLMTPSSTINSEIIGAKRRSQPGRRAMSSGNS